MEAGIISGFRVTLAIFIWLSPLIVPFMAPVSCLR
jgi:hypothetical protein